jgi:hypothetical protein
MSKITLTADQMVGKNLYAVRNVKAFSLPNSSSELWAGYQPGQLIGKVYSWVIRNGVVWWMFEANYSQGSVNVKYYYVKHNADDFGDPLPQFTPEEQAAIREQNKIDLPNWLTFGAAAFAWYQSTQPEGAKYKVALRLGAVLAATYGVTKVVEKIDFNPFDDLLNTGG